MPMIALEAKPKLERNNNKSVDNIIVEERKRRGEERCEQECWQSAQKFEF